MKYLLLPLILLFTSCEDKVFEPETRIVQTPTICPEPNPEITASKFKFEEIKDIDNITRTSAIIKWDKAEGFHQYNIIEIRSKDRVIHASIDKDQSTFQLNNLTPETEYTFMVRAIDNAGFLETNTNSITFKTLPWPNFSNQKSLALNGSQALELPPSDKLNLGNEFTVSNWVKVSEILQKDARIFTLHKESFATTALSIGISGGKIKLIYSTEKNELKEESVEVNIFNNQWAHLVLTKKNNQINLYLNNIKIISLKENLAKFGSHPAFIGSYSGIQKGLVGKVDEFSIFNKAFSYQKIVELNNNGLSMDLSDHSMYSHLILWYQIGDQSTDNTTNITDVISSLNATPLNIKITDFVIDSP